jgi:cytochrome c oxidase cbb3-type subunit II
MAYRMKPTVPLLVVKDETGRLHHHYNQAISGSVSYGSIIPYLNNEQREHFLRLGLVEEITDEEAAVQTQPAPREDLVPGVNAELVDDCIADLDRLGVAADSGAPTCRKVLRDAGISYGNDVIAAAVRQRKMRPAPLSGTAAS